MSIEERLEQLERRLEEAELALAKERIRSEIQNIMGRYCYMHSGGWHTECMEFFANGNPELTIEIGPTGLYRGADAARRVYHIGHNAGEGDRQGFLAEHTLTTAVIEVADDLQSAKSIWISPGHETVGCDPDTGKPDPTWMWGRYAMDWINVGGAWKILHFQMFPTFHCSYYTSWAETEPFDRIWKKEMQEKGADAESFLPGVHPDAPTTFYEEYAADRKMKYWPQPPKPYKTLAGSRSMVGAPPAGLCVSRK